MIVNLLSLPADPRLVILEAFLKDVDDPRTEEVDPLFDDLIEPLLKDPKLPPDLKHPAHKGPAPALVEDKLLTENEDAWFAELEEEALAEDEELLLVELDDPELVLDDPDTKRDPVEEPTDNPDAPTPDVDVVILPV